MATRGRSQPAPLGVVVAAGLLGTICIAWGGWRVGALLDRSAHGRWLGGTPVLRSFPLPPRFVGFTLWGLGLALLSLAWWALHDIARRESRPSDVPVTARPAAAARGPDDAPAAGHFPAAPLRGIHRDSVERGAEEGGPGGGGPVASGRGTGALPSGRLRPGVVGVIALVWALPLALGPPLGSSDVYSYVAHGELASRGLDPGESAPLALGPDAPALQSVDPIWRGVVSAYGPAATALSEGAVRVSDHSVAGAVLVWRALAAAGVALAGLAVVALPRRTGRNPTDALVRGGSGPLTLVQLVGGAHNETVMIGLL